MIHGIIETNILAGANRMADHLDETSQDRCIIFIKDYHQNAITYLDEDGFIMNEYRSYCNGSGRPNVGDYFFKWLWDNQHNENICKKVTVTAKDKDGYDFYELNEYTELSAFDKSDKKFVAVCVSAKCLPVIYNACDSDWDEYKETFLKYKIQITQILD